MFVIAMTLLALDSVNSLYLLSTAVAQPATNKMPWATLWASRFKASQLARPSLQFSLQPRGLKQKPSRFAREREK